MALTYGFCLGSDITSKQFAEAIASVIGNGVCGKGSKFTLTLQSGLGINVGTGFAVANGRYIKNDGTETFSLLPSGNTQDRYDALVVRVNHEERKCEMCVLENIEPGKVIRNENEYNIALYLIHIKRGATVLYANDISDLRNDINVCGYLTPLSAMSVPVMSVYNYLTQELDSKIEDLYDMLDTSSNEIDAKITRVSAIGNAIIDDAEEGITYLDGIIGAAQGTNIGEIAIAMDMPVPQGEWLLCDGSPVPEGYPDLSVLLEGTLPDITQPEALFKAWIYCGRQNSTNEIKEEFL